MLEIKYPYIPLEIDCLEVVEFAEFHLNHAVSDFGLQERLSYMEGRDVYGAISTFSTLNLIDRRNILHGIGLEVGRIETNTIKEFGGSADISGLLAEEALRCFVDLMSARSN